MEFLENTLYKTDAEKQFLVSNAQEIMDALYINYFGVIGLYKLSEKPVLKKYFKDDKKLTSSNITDDNNDNSLSVKLAVDNDLIKKTTANKMTKLLALLKKGSLSSDDIDIEQVRALIKEIPLSSRGTTRINTAAKMFADGEIDLNQYTKSMHKESIKKGYKFKTNEFSDILLMGGYVSLLKDIDINRVIEKQTAEVMNPTVVPVTPAVASTPTGKRKSIDIAREIMQSTDGQSRKEIIQSMVDAGISPKTAAVYYHKFKGPVRTKPVDTIVQKDIDITTVTPQPVIIPPTPKNDINDWLEQIISVTTENKVNELVNQLDDKSGLSLLAERLESILSDESLSIEEFTKSVKKYQYHLKAVREVYSVITELSSILGKKVIGYTKDYDSMASIKMNDIIKTFTDIGIIYEIDDIDIFRNSIINEYHDNSNTVDSNINNIYIAELNRLATANIKNLNVALGSAKKKIEQLNEYLIETYTRPPVSNLIKLTDLIEAIPQDKRNFANKRFVYTLFCGGYLDSPGFYIKNIEKFCTMQEFFMNLKHDVSEPYDIKVYVESFDTLPEEMREGLIYLRPLLTNFIKVKLSIHNDIAITQGDLTDELILLINSIRKTKSIDRKDFDNIVKNLSSDNAINSIDWDKIKRTTLSLLWDYSKFPKEITSVYLKFVNVVNTKFDRVAFIYNSMLLERELYPNQAKMIVDFLYERMFDSSNKKLDRNVYLGAIIYRIMDKFSNAEGILDSNIDLNKVVKLAETLGLESVPAELYNPQYYPYFSKEWKLNFLDRKFDSLGIKEIDIFEDFTVSMVKIRKYIESNDNTNFGSVIDDRSGFKNPSEFYHEFYKEDFDGFKQYIDFLSNITLSDSYDKPKEYQVRLVGSKISKNYTNIEASIPDLIKEVSEAPSMGYGSRGTQYGNLIRAINSSDIGFFEKVVNQMPLSTESDAVDFINLLRNGMGNEYVNVDYKHIDIILSKLMPNKMAMGVFNAELMNDSYANTKFASLLNDHMNALTESDYKTMTAEETVKLINYGNLVKKGSKSTRQEYAENIADIAYMMYKENTKECDRLMAMLPTKDTKKILTRMSSILTVKRILDSGMLYNSDIKPLKKLTDAEVIDLLKFNTLLPDPPPAKGIKSVKDIESAVNAIDLSYLEKMDITKIAGDKEYFERQSVEFYKFTNKHHGNVALEFLEEYDVRIPNNKELYDQWVSEHPGTDTIYPVFHGTGSIPASMILRAGFKNVDPSSLKSIKVTGKGLGPGIYFTNILNKSAQYVGDKGYGRTLGDVGYIFSMKAALGDWFRNYETGGNVTPRKERPNARKWDSPEWVVREGNKQCLVLKAYKVVKTSRSTIREMREKYNLSEGNIMEIKAFKEFMVESTYDNYQYATTYTFNDGMIPIGELESIESEEFNPEKYGDHVKLSYSQFGPMVVIYHNEESKQASYMIDYSDSFTTSELGKTYLEMLNKK